MGKNQIAQREDTENLLASSFTSGCVWSSHTRERQEAEGDLKLVDMQVLNVDFVPSHPLPASSPEHHQIWLMWRPPPAQTPKADLLVLQWYSGTELSPHHLNT